MASPQPLEVFVGHQSVARQGPQTVSSPPSTPPMVATPSPVAVRGALVPPRPASVAQPPAGAGTNVHPTSHLQSHAYRSMAHVQQPLQRPHHLPMHAPQPHPAFLGVPVPLLHNHLTGRPGSPTVIDIVPTTLSAGPSAAARAGLTGLVATQTPAQRPQHLTSHLHHHHPHHHQHRGSASDASGASGSTDLNNDPHHPQHSPSPLYDPPSHHAHQDHNMPPSDEKVFQALTPEELAEVRTHPLRMQRKIARFIGYRKDPQIKELDRAQACERCVTDGYPCFVWKNPLATSASIWRRPCVTCYHQRCPFTEEFVDLHDNNQGYASEDEKELDDNARRVLKRAAARQVDRLVTSPRTAKANKKAGKRAARAVPDEIEVIELLDDDDDDDDEDDDVEDEEDDYEEDDYEEEEGQHKRSPATTRRSATRPAARPATANDTPSRRRGVAAAPPRSPLPPSASSSSSRQQSRELPPPPLSFAKPKPSAPATTSKKGKGKVEDIDVTSGATVEAFARKAPPTPVSLEPASKRPTSSPREVVHPEPDFKPMDFVDELDPEPESKPQPLPAAVAPKRVAAAVRPIEQNVKPVKPVNSVRPVEPVKQVKHVKHVKHAKPAEPEEPEEPVKHVKPVEPVEPEAGPSRKRKRRSSLTKYRFLGVRDPNAEFAWPQSSPNDAVYNIHQSLFDADPSVKWEVMSPFEDDEQPEMDVLRPTDVHRVPFLTRLVQIDEPLATIIADMPPTSTLIKSNDRGERFLPPYLYTPSRGCVECCEKEQPCVLANVRAPPPSLDPGHPPPLMTLLPLTCLTCAGSCAECVYLIDVGPQVIHTQLQAIAWHKRPPPSTAGGSGFDERTVWFDPQTAFLASDAAAQPQ